MTKLREATYTIESKEDLLEIDSLFRKIVIEGRVMDHDLSDVVFEKSVQVVKENENPTFQVKSNVNRETRPPRNADQNKYEEKRAEYNN